MVADDRFQLSLPFTPTGPPFSLTNLTPLPGQDTFLGCRIVWFANGRPTVRVCQQPLRLVPFHCNTCPVQSRNMMIERNSGIRELTCSTQGWSRLGAHLDMYLRRYFLYTF